MYGDASPLPSVPAVSDGSDTSTPTFELAYSSPEARIGSAQTTQLVVNSLVHCYRDKLLHRVPIMTDFESFVSRFEDAGRTWTRLGQADRATSCLVMALSARVTDLPLIAGVKAPTLEKVVEATSDGYELTEFGEARHAVCRSLEEKARSQVERTFMNSDVSVDAIAAREIIPLLASPTVRELTPRRVVMSMQMIDDTNHEVSEERRPRIYSSTAIEHLRTLALRPFRTALESAALDGPMIRGAILLDALWDTRPMQISDDDLQLLYPNCFARRAASAASEIFVASPRECSLLLSEHLIMLSRKTRRLLGSPVRRGARPRPDPDAFASCFAEGCLLIRAADLALSKVDSPFEWVMTIRSAKIAFVVQLGLVLADGLAWWHLDTGGDEKAFSPLTETLERIGPMYISHLIESPSPACPPEMSRS